MLVTDVILTGTAHAQLYDTHVSAQAEKLKFLKTKSTTFVIFTEVTTALLHVFPLPKEPSKHHIRVTRTRTKIIHP